MAAKSKVSQLRFVDSWTPYQAWFSSVTGGNQGKCIRCRDMFATLFKRSWAAPVKENGSQRRIPNEQVRSWKTPIFLLNFLLLYIFITNGCAETDIPLKVTIKSSILLRSLYCQPRVISITERGFSFDFYRQSFIFDGQGFYVPYSPAFRQVPLQRTIPPPPPTAAVVPAGVTEKKKNRWSETEEKLLIEV